MRKQILHFIPLFIAFIWGNYATAQSNIPASFPVDFITQFQDIFVDQNGVGLVVGKCGVVRKTDNDGQKWTTASSPTDDDIWTVTCSPEGCAKALLATDQKLYRLENNVWSDVTYPNFSQAGQLHWLTPQVVLHETTGKEYYRSTDGGLSWTAIELITFQQSNMSIIDNQNGYVIIDKKLYGTTDGWASIDSIGYTHPVQVYNMTWLDQQNGWIFDQDRFFYGTTDAGKTWALLNETSQLTSVNWFVALSTTHLVGAQVTTQRLESTDGGITWTRDQFLPNGSQRVNEKYHKKGDAFFLVGNQSQLLYSASGFADFSELDPFNRQDRIGPIAFASNDVGYALAFTTLIVTENAGTSWTEKPLPGIGRDLEVLANGDLVILSDATSFKSSDRGETFTEWIDNNIIPENEHPRKISIKPNGDIYLTSSNYGYLSTDGGNTFTAIQTNHEFEANGLFFLDNNNGYAVGRQSKYMTTSDGGQTWTVGEWPANNSVDIYFTDEDNGWISEARTRYVTSDRGQTWTSAGSTGGYDMTFNPGDGSILTARFGSGNIGELVRSKDDGLTWEIIGTNCFSYRSGAITPNGKYFFTGGDGFLVRHDLESITTGTKTIKQRKANALIAYPNPTSDQIQIEIPNMEHRSIVRMYNSNGIELLQKVIAPQQERVELSMESLPTGLYFVHWVGQKELATVRVIKE